jgi:hypothetical protein
VQQTDAVLPRPLLDLDYRRGLPLWHIEGHAFDLRFRASGYRQYFRRPPRLVSRSTLPPTHRGGCSFDEIASE